MHRDGVPFLSVAPERRQSVDWSSLLDAMGTLQFELEFERVLSALAGWDYPPTISHEASIAAFLQSNLDWVESNELSRRLGGWGDALTAIARKHIQAIQRDTDRRPTEPLTSVDIIEQCLADCTSLPRRELEVCARILYGLSSVGIALDLVVSEATVKTYRKRAYQRLSIGCERELITWYLRAWNSWQPSRRQRDHPRIRCGASSC